MQEPKYNLRLFGIFAFSEESQKVIINSKLEI